jgi:hypothetical protein
VPRQSYVEKRGRAFSWRKAQLQIGQCSPIGIVQIRRRLTNGIADLIGLIASILHNQGGILGIKGQSSLFHARSVGINLGNGGLTNENRGESGIRTDDHDRAPCRGGPLQLEQTGHGCHGYIHAGSGNVGHVGILGWMSLLA